VDPAEWQNMAQLPLQLLPTVIYPLYTAKQKDNAPEMTVRQGRKMEFDYRLFGF
jgi:hypothetical protein